MRKINYYRMLLGGISLLGLANVVQAQCVTPPTCAQLGYTKTASECSGHTFLKCPFDMSVGYCDLGTSSTPVVNVCGTPEVGDILYSDMTCNTNVVISKTPIGVVFDTTNKLAVGMVESEASYSYGGLQWSKEYFDVPGLSNITSWDKVTADWQGKKNTQIVLPI